MQVRLTVLLIIAFAATAVFAQTEPTTQPSAPSTIQSRPQFFGPQDPQIREIISTADAFLRAIAHENVAKAHELFAGDAQQAELLDAHFKMVRASQRMLAEAKPKFGERPEIGMLDASRMFTQLADGLATKFVVVNGDRAAIAAGLFIDQGMSLRQIDGKWRVDALSLRSKDVKTPRALVDAFSAMFASGSEMLSRKDGLIFEQFAQALDAQARRAMEQLLESTLPRVVAIQPGDVPELPAGWTPIPLQRLRAAFAHKLTEPESSELIALLPNLPVVTETTESIFITSPEAGLSLHFSGKDGTLLSISFGNEGWDGCRAYRGELPGRLSLDDVRRDVERKLGRPTISSGGDVVAYEADYGGIYVGYQGMNLRDPANPIAHVVLFSATPLVGQGTAVAAAPRARLTLHLVAQPHQADDANVQRLQHLDGKTPAVSVLKEVLLDDSDIEFSYPVPARDATERNQIGLKMTPAGSAKLHKVTAAHVGESLAFVLDGKVLIAPRINGPIQPSVMIDLGDQPDDGFRDIARRIHLAISALPEGPTTRPQAR